MISVGKYKYKPRYLIKSKVAWLSLLPHYKCFNPDYAIDFVMRFKRTQNQRVMDAKHPLGMVKDITRTKCLIHSYFGSE